MPLGDSKVEKIQTNLQALASVATSLNTASDELTRTVSVLDEALKKLNVGLTVWVNSISTDVEPPEYDTEQIGYCKVNGKWGIALRRIWGDEMLDRHHEDGPWLFNDAPREMRLYGVDGIPQVIEALHKQASEATKRIQEKTEEVRALTDAIEKLANGRTLVSVGISSAQVKDILSGVQRQQKFLGGLVMHATRWELQGSELRICFPSEKNAFAEMLQGRDSLATVRKVGQEVLGTPVQVTVHLEPKPVGVGYRTSTGGGNVQK